MNTHSHIELGCGLIRIGRTWGFKANNVPTEEEVQIFLKEAVNSGIRFFDTAPAYALSELRLGQFLKTLSSDQRDKLTIATKCGEIWDEENQTTIVDHSYPTLIKSIDKSLSLLGRIDMLQVHKATSTVLQSPDVHKAIAYAKAQGIKEFGASVSDLETARLLSTMNELSVAQLPYNPERTDMQDALDLLKAKNKFIIINRPFNMGGMLYRDQNEKAKEELLIQAYKFILKENFSGVVLTGTATSKHLEENLEAFKTAKNIFHKKQ